MATSEESNPEALLTSAEGLTELPWNPVRKRHIIHCSYHFWHPLYRKDTPKARLIPLSQAFMDYLGEDGIVLPSEEDDPEPTWDDQDSGVFSEDRSDDEDADALLDPSVNFRETHDQIKDTINELGGKVAPKLNWSAPKDATWISATNSMECSNPSDIYLLLKSSDFVTHDIEYPFADCVDDEESPLSIKDIPYHLILRKYLNFNPSLEFRCFVKDRTLIGICQRDLNHFDFLFPMRDTLGIRMQKFFDEKLKFTFPDASFVFDVYIPPPHKRVWLIDINPWAPRTDPLLFSWLELLQHQVTPENSVADESQNSDSGSEEDLPAIPEFRLIRKDDPEAYGFTSPQYSAHKLPREVVDASRQGSGGIREFADQWHQIMQEQEQNAD